MKECITHHACDCIQARVKEEEAKVQAVRKALSEKCEENARLREALNRALSYAGPRAPVRRDIEKILKGESYES